MSIFDAIAQGSNVGEGINAFARNSYLINQQQAQDAERKQQNAFVRQRDDMAIKQQGLMQAAQIYAATGNMDQAFSHLDYLSQQYGYAPADRQQLAPHLEGLAATFKQEAKDRVGAVSPDKYTPESLAEFQKTGDYSKLQPVIEPTKPERPVPVVQADGKTVWMSPSEAVGKPVGSTTAETGTKPPSMTDELKLRQEFNNITKDFRLQEDALGRIIASTKSPSAAGDVALVFNFMKMLDPGSTVREGEFMTAEQATGVPGRIVNLYNKLISGERLSDAQRQDFLSQSGNIYDSAVQNYNKTYNEYRGLAQAYNANPDRIGIRGPRYKKEDYAPASSSQPYLYPKTDGAPQTDSEGWMTLPNGVQVRKKP